MFYNFDGSIDDSDHRLYLAKDRTKAAKPGKYQQRAKADRPKDKLAEAKTERCHKMKISSIEIAKSIIASARWSRAKAAAEGRTSKRLEDRWYLCDTCSGGAKKAKIYHGTRLNRQRIWREIRGIDDWRFLACGLITQIRKIRQHTTKHSAIWSHKVKF